MNCTSGTSAYKAKTDAKVEADMSKSTLKFKAFAIVSQTPLIAMDLFSHPC